MDDGKYNYVAYLLSDNNSISMKVATYSGNDSYELIENEEYGYCSLIKATKSVVDKFNRINRTFTKITGLERKEVEMVDTVSVREAVINSIVHNRWEREVPPRFEIFSDHISITSSGGIPENFTKEEFLKGYSSPVNPELMRIFKDLDLVEQLGTGIKRILKYYDEDIYEFTPNFIKVDFKFKNGSELNKITNTINAEEEDKLTETQRKIVELINENHKITQDEISKKLGIAMITVARNLKDLKEKNIIRRNGSNKNGQWEIL